MPGCSSCLRMKEFIEKTGVEYESYNIDAEPERRAKLYDHGINNVPAVCIGDRCITGVDLAAVAELMGVEYTVIPPLPADVLVGRYRLLIQALHRYLRQLPEGGLDYRLPNRKRPMRNMINQIASVMRAFLSAYYKDDYDTSCYRKPDEIQTVDDISRRADETLASFEKWWAEDGFDDPLDRIVTAYWGMPTLHEVLERETWHTAQHLRQLEFVLGELGVEPDGPLTDAELAGLPLPERIHG
jgi:glutaredoxin